MLREITTGARVFCPFCGGLGGKGLGFGCDGLATLLWPCDARGGQWSVKSKKHGLQVARYAAAPARGDLHRAAPHRTWDRPPTSPAGHHIGIREGITITVAVNTPCQENSLAKFARALFSGGICHDALLNFCFAGTHSLIMVICYNTLNIIVIF